MSELRKHNLPVVHFEEGGGRGGRTLGRECP